MVQPALCGLSPLAHLTLGMCTMDRIESVWPLMTMMISAFSASITQIVLSTSATTAIPYVSSIQRVLTASGQLMKSAIPGTSTTAPSHFQVRSVRSSLPVIQRPMWSFHRMQVTDAVWYCNVFTSCLVSQSQMRAVESEQHVANSLCSGQNATSRI